MGLKTTRTILCILLSFVIAAATLVTLVSSVLNITFAAPSFLTEKIVTHQLISACTEQLHIKYTALEAESGIPARVFETATENSGVEISLKTAAANIFSPESSSLYSEERVDYFYKLCTEYFDGNSIEYNEKNVRRVSEKAARIYSDTLGIHNTESIEKYISGYKQSCLKLISAGVVTIALCCSMICLVYKKKSDILFAVGCGGAGGGVAAVISALAGLILKIGSEIVFYPSAYQQSLYSMTRLGFIYLLLMGFGCAIVSYLLIIYSVKRYEKERKRRNIF